MVSSCLFASCSLQDYAAIYQRYLGGYHSDEKAPDTTRAVAARWLGTSCSSSSGGMLAIVEAILWITLTPLL